MSEWTILMFLAADNDLAAQADRTLAQLAAAYPCDRVRILVQVDRPKVGSTRYEIRDGRVLTLTQLGPVDTGDPATLRGFLQWGRQTAPSTKVAAVIWNHGGATLGLDKGAGGDFLTNDELRSAIAEPVDLLACDACLTGTLEMANTVRDRAQVYVAPETNTPRNGWPYTAILNALGRDPAMGAEELGGAIVQAFRAVPHGPAELNAWRLSAIGELADAMDALGAALEATGRTSATVARRRDMIAMEDPDYVDLESFLASVEAAPELVDRCRRALAAARVADPEQLGGLSILFQAPDSHWVESRAGDPSRINLAGLRKPGWTSFLETALAPRQRVYVRAGRAPSPGPATAP